MQISANTGSRIIATEANVSTSQRLLLRQNAGLNPHRAGTLPANLYHADIQYLLPYGLRPAKTVGFAAAWP
ncbi:hypothetical protein B9929_00900 [Salmonella enterica]|uniref:Uncharacterized protein n=2 Tax=Salmonella enterica TaxID=28901 RepID=A0A5V1J2R7_SALER|nr:hypothetical protein [Salmonella enterica]EDT6508836.1 hypothetical protein [Salmonella enterica subsp. enterica serovar Tallahassee]EDX4411322.1 hypothetical protein [Salmonella enterica subsp. houtenae serovar 44:z36,[z38]:-]HAC6489958.1 hypothetical protein [Salmonella enterica subsp. houtenae serovar 44:z36[z38]:-]EAM8933917.1 hypothetical protein [Salmonella enterica]